METVLFIIVQMLANVIQAISGFAGGPLAMPPSMQLVGVNTAKSVITLLFLFSTAVVAIQYRKHINVKILIKMLCIMAIGLLPSLWLYTKIRPTELMIIYGILVAGIGVWKLIKPKSEGFNGVLGYVFLIVSGIMQGMFTSGGPFAVIYASSVMHDKNEFRATVSAVWAILNTCMCITMLGQGMYHSYEAKLTFLSLLPVFLAILVGNQISKRMNQSAFQRLVCVLLIVSGALLLYNVLG